MSAVLLVVHLLLALGLVGVILIQRSEGGGLGIGGGSTGGFMSARGTANLLTRTTAILAGLFMATSLGLAVLASSDRAPPPSLLDTGKPTAPVEQPLGTLPTVPPAAPAEGTPDKPSVPVAR